MMLNAPDQVILLGLIDFLLRDPVVAHFHDNFRQCAKSLLEYLELGANLYHYPADSGLRGRIHEGSYGDSPNGVQVSDVIIIHVVQGEGMPSAIGQHPVLSVVDEKGQVDHTYNGRNVNDENRPSTTPKKYKNYPFI